MSPWFRVSKVKQVLEFNNLRTNIALFWCFENKVFVRIINFSQPMLLFQKLVDETQMSKPQEGTFILTKKFFSCPPRSSKYYIKSGRKTLYMELFPRINNLYCWLCFFQKILDKFLKCIRIISYIVYTLKYVSVRQ